MNDFLDQFEFPEVAKENFINKGLTQQTINSGQGGVVSTFTMAGHQNGVPFRFTSWADQNLVKSEMFDMEINDEVELIEWFVNKDHKPTERVTHIGDHFLKFRRVRTPMPDGTYRMMLPKDNDGKIILDCVGGKLKEAYVAWKAGLTSPGLPLSRWEKLTLGQVMSLNSLGVFSVEQFAAMPRDRVEGRMPEDLVHAFEQAILYVNSQRPMQDVKIYADQMLELRQQMAKQERENAQLRETVENLMAAPLKKKAGRPRKVQVEVNESVES